MRKILFAAAGFAALVGAAGLAVAQDGPPPGAGQGPGGVFALDANNDGTLTRREFDAGRTAEFARLDANNDGQLTREERREGRQGREGHDGRGHRGERDGHRGGGMHMLANADANNDGAITRDEFLARPIEHFNQLDANHDGVIQAAERPQRPERGDGPRGERPDRPNPDANNDGQLSRAEFSAMGASMFERLDANNDGRVTQEEAQAARPHHRGRG